MTTSEEYTEEEEKGGDFSQNNDFIYLICFELLEWLIRGGPYQDVTYDLILWYVLKIIYFF